MIATAQPSRFWAWAGLLALGTASQLMLTEPMWLQHLRISPGDLKANPWNAAFLAVALLHVAIVGVAALRSRSAIGAMLSFFGRLRPLHVLLALVLFLACGAHLTRYVNKTQFAALSYAAQLGVTAAFFVANVLNVVLVLLHAPAGRIRAIGDRLSSAGWSRALPWILAAWTFAASLVLGRVALDQVPHIPDEVCYVFQAECLARGVFWGPAPPNPAAFQVYLVPAENGRWFATTSIGWPALLALGSAIGAPWLVNPLLGALGVLLAHALTKRLIGLKEAHLVALLLATSPWLLYLSASFMTHPASLVFMLASWLCVAKADAVPRRVAWSLLGGALLGWLFLIRQLDAVLFAGITGLWMLGTFRKRLSWAAIVAFGAGCAAVAALVFPYNAMMTGNPFTFPLNAYMDRLWYPGINRLGFGADVGNPTGGWGDLDPFPGHGLRDVLVNTNQNLYATGYELFGWSIGSLFFVVMHSFFGKKTGVDRLLFFTVAVLLLGYNLYWFSGGPDFGARYWYLMIYPLAVLTARGLGACTGLLGQGPAGGSAPHRMAAAIGTLVVLALAIFIPWRAVTRYQHYRGFHADYRKLEKTLDPRALVFVKTKSGDLGMRGDADYSSAFIRNSPILSEARPIFAKDLGDAENQKLIAAFPGRPVVYVTGRSMGTGPTRVEPASSRQR